ncbi:MAG: RIP metalloprotease RseP [Vicinamibacterales bacterium]
MTTLLAFIFVLGVLIFVHELGHFLMARRLGVRVITFSLGFGPRIVSVRRGQTEYRLSAVPLGGYVKMAGENPDDQLSGTDDEFLSKSKWQRFQILVMGPVMNILLAIVLMSVVLMNGAQVPAFHEEPVVVGAVIEGSPAEAAGIMPGDRIIEVAGREVPTWEDFSIAIGTRANRPVPVVLLREGRRTTVEVVPDARTEYEIGEIGVLPDVYPHVQAVNPGEPADRAGIRPGDVIRAINGQRMVFSEHVAQAISRHPERPVTLELLRDGKPLTVEVVPLKRGAIGVIGIGIGNQLKTIDPGPFEAVLMSIEKNYEFSGLIFRTVWGLFTRETSPKQLMGPVAIAQLSGEYAQAGWMALFTLMASISLNLGLLNLLPIPVLDGGHILIMIMEGLARRDFSMKVKEKMLLAGFVLLMVLMVTVIYNDLTRIQWIERLMFWR